MFISQGCSGGINGLAAVLGEPLCKMHELARAGHWKNALELQRKLVNIDLLVNYRTRVILRDYLTITQNNNINIKNYYKILRRVRKLEKESRNGLRSIIIRSHDLF